MKKEALAQEYAHFAEEIQAAVARVLASGRYILASEVEAFEAEAAAYLGVRYAIGCNSGTDALLLSLLACEIGPGDEVITTPFSFFATAATISRVGATPVFADIDPRTFNLDPARVAELITSRTRAIIPVHLFGQAADMTEFRRLADEHGLLLIEDAAQAFAARWAGQPVGTFGDLAAFSFYPTKNLGACGDAGLVTTNHPELARRVRILRQQGVDGLRYHHELMGINSRLDELQAAILRVKLPHLADLNAKRHLVAAIYDAGLAAVAGVCPPYVHPQATHIYHQYTIRTPYRDELRRFLADCGVETDVYYPVLLPDQPAYRNARYPFRTGPLPEARRATREVLSLPISPYLSHDQAEMVAERIKTFLTTRNGAVPLVAPNGKQESALSVAKS